MRRIFHFVIAFQEFVRVVDDGHADLDLSEQAAIVNSLQRHWEDDPFERPEEFRTRLRKSCLRNEEEAVPARVYRGGGTQQKQCQCKLSHRAWASEPCTARPTPMPAGLVCAFHSIRVHRFAFLNGLPTSTFEKLPIRRRSETSDFRKPRRTALSSC